MTNISDLPPGPIAITDVVKLREMLQRAQDTRFRDYTNNVTFEVLEQMVAVLERMDQDRIRR